MIHLYVFFFFGVCVCVCFFKSRLVITLRPIMLPKESDSFILFIFIVFNSKLLDWIVVHWTIAITEALKLKGCPVCRDKAPKTPSRLTSSLSLRLALLSFAFQLGLKMTANYRSESRLGKKSKAEGEKMEGSKSAAGCCQEPCCESVEGFGSLISDKRSTAKLWNYWSPWQCGRPLQILGHVQTNAFQHPTFAAF